MYIQWLKLYKQNIRETFSLHCTVGHHISLTCIAQCGCYKYVSLLQKILRNFPNVKNTLNFRKQDWSLLFILCSFIQMHWLYQEGLLNTTEVWVGLMSGMSCLDVMFENSADRFVHALCTFAHFQCMNWEVN